MKKRGTAVVTGASRGIGAAIATALAKEGYDLALICKNSIEQLEKRAVDIRTIYKVGVTAHQCDISNKDSVEKISNDILIKNNHVDCLINNAGIARFGLLTDMQNEEWDEVMDTNLKSCFLLAKAFVPSMIRRQSGNIINISSIWGTYGASCEVAYSASKGGLNAFTKALAKELAPSHIAVNAISCGVIDTDMNARLSEEEREELRQSIPADRFGTPEDVANTVLGILKMSYVTGQIIGCDGGW